MAGSGSEFVVHYVPKEFRPTMDSSDSNKDDTVWVTSIGDTFTYVIPSFDVLAVELRQIKISGYNRRDGKERILDLFIRNDASLCRTYPAVMIIKDVTIIKVCIQV